jgi:hypothetical protein
MTPPLDDAAHRRFEPNVPANTTGGNAEPAKPTEQQPITPIGIPRELIDAGARFILVNEKGKDAFELNWETSNNYSADSPKLQAHLSAGGNYGCTNLNGVGHIDVDEPMQFGKNDVNFLKNTFVVVRGNSGRGHIYFKCSNCPPEMRKLFKTSFGDVRTGGNHYVVAPNSTHPSGDIYSVHRAMPLADIDWAELKTLIDNNPLPERTTTGGSDGNFNLPDVIHETTPGRNDTLYRYGCSLRALGRDAEEITTLIRAANIKRCKPDPLPDDEIDDLLRQVIQKPKGVVVTPERPFPQAPQPAAGNANVANPKKAAERMMQTIYSAANAIRASTEIYGEDARIEKMKAVQNAIYLRECGFSRGHDFSLLAINKRCDPPLTEDEITATRDAAIAIIDPIVEMFNKGEADEKTQSEKQKEESASERPLPCYAKRRWTIHSEERMEERTRTALGAILDANIPPFVFKRAGKLAEIVLDDKTKVPSIKTMNESRIRGVMERTAEYMEEDRVTREDRDIPPPLDCVKDLASQPDWDRIPAIIGLTEAPIIHLDGTIVSVTGYDPVTCLYYHPKEGFVMPDIPEKPTKEDVMESVKLVREIFMDFPFVGEKTNNPSEANTIATLLSLVIRPSIDGCVPMALIDKPQPGTGASLIAEVIGRIANGRLPETTTAPVTEEEWRKKLHATLSTGRIFTIIDNVEKKIESASLASTLTSRLVEDRILGKSENAAYDNQTMWVATGNNIMVGGDLPRRCYLIRMDAKVARPWERDKFTHQDIRGWVIENRGRILAAILTMTRSWIQAGKPKPDSKLPKMGSFEEWRDIIGGILEHCEVKGFLTNLENMYLMSDADTPQWEMFLERWHNIWNDSGVTVAEVVKILEMGNKTGQQEIDTSDSLFNALPDALADAFKSGKSFNRVFGNTMAKMNDRVFNNGYVISRGEISHHAVTWVVSKVTTNPTNTPERTGS